MESAQSSSESKEKEKSNEISTSISIEGKDDVTGEPLYQREDDRAEVIRHRLETFDKNFYPIMEFYKFVRFFIFSNESNECDFCFRRKIDVLKQFEGRESDKIWPEVKNYLDRVLQPSAA